MMKKVDDNKLITLYIKKTRKLKFERKNDSIYEFLSENIIKHSDTFIKIENKLYNVWENQHYWRQKQAYEELIKEIK